MRMYDIIEKKRNGEELTTAEINWFLDGYVDGSIPDYQVSALCMAIYFKGMSDREITDLTIGIENSGENVDLSDLNGLAVDKHSTGGVGDKTTLIVAPIVASLGGKVAKMSGRGLGHTGGTVDKLESIKGYNTSLSREDFINQVKNVGIAVIGQSGNLTPADKKLYALRDVTATVDSIPLIVSSIMGKKLAAGANSIVLDVKYGSGAFMKTKEDAVVLAEKMVKIGKMCNKKISALVTNMDIPLGCAVGNALEVKEAVSVLKGETKGELSEISVALATEMLSLCFGIPSETARLKVLDAIDSKSALNKFREWITAQGGNADFIDNPQLMCPPKFESAVVANKSGYISKINAEEIGKCAVMLGAGREKKDDLIDFSAGIILEKQFGEYVKKGNVLARLYSSVTDDFRNIESRMAENIEISENPPETEPLIFKTVK